AEEVDRLLKCRIGRGRLSRLDRNRHVRLQARLVDPAPCRRPPPGDRQSERAAFAGQLLPLLDGALPERLLADEERPARVLQRPRDDLTGRCALAVDETDDANGWVGRE